MIRNIVVLLLIVTAFAGGYGYGRWYAKLQSAGAPNERKVLYWVDPMHPWYKSDKPGIAPDCNMKLEPVYADSPQAGAPASAAAQPFRMPPGTVQITPEKQQLIGVEFGTVDYHPAIGTVRAAARVAMDETRIAKVQSKIEGWIDQVFVDFTGKQVEKGQPLVTIYSPEALATQQEYLLAIKAQKTMAHNPIHDLALSSDTLLAAARRRLELWDISEQQIESITRSGKPLKNLRLDAPQAGVVVERNAYSSQRVMPDTILYTLADLSKVWVMADVFEYEAAQIRLGQTATMTMPYLPGRVFHGRVNYILPQVDPATRTLKVRVEFPNPNLQLKPDMYGDVEFRTGGSPKLAVARQAVLNSGAEQVVFVDRGNGYFEPRKIVTGAQMGDRVEVLSGLQAGERIVTSGNFLIDSESQLQTAGSGIQAAAAGQQGAGHAH